MAEKVYPIRINKTGRYVKYCDDNWYETSSEPTMKYTEERCNQIVKQLKNHYVYDVTIEGIAPVVTVDATPATPVAKKGSISYLKEILKRK